MKFWSIPYLLLLTAPLAYGQQWVERQFVYDSLMNVPYGAATNFLGGQDTLFMDIYLPKCPDDSVAVARPLLLWFHGGAFLAGDKNDSSIQAFCKDFAKRGYVTASIGYRLGFVADDAAWSCNYPNYNCVFATDSIEWARAYYRAVQDCKGGLRYLVNRHQSLNIDINNIFVAGESAGAFIALGVGLLDTVSEKPIQAYAQPDAPRPHPNTFGCPYNTGSQLDSSLIERPDLGHIDGDIEPTTYQYTIKGIGNMYGAMLTDLLYAIPAGKYKPAIYSFHQPCDMVVPIDSNVVYWGLSWCFTNGYNCYAIANNKIMLYGSRVFRNWNNANNYGYTIQSEFTSVGFPYSFLFGQGSCLDQVNNPCHAYDSRSVREHNLAVFFADNISSNGICDSPSSSFDLAYPEPFLVYPNPVMNELTIQNKANAPILKVQVYNLLGQLLLSKASEDRHEITLDTSWLHAGIYLIRIESKDGQSRVYKITKAGQ